MVTVNRLHRIIAEREAALSRVADSARQMTLDAPANDLRWQDTTASQVAVGNARHAASLALDLLALLEAARLMDGNV